MNENLLQGCIRLNYFYQCVPNKLAMECMFMWILYSLEHTAIIHEVNENVRAKCQKQEKFFSMGPREEHYL